MEATPVRRRLRYINMKKQPAITGLLASLGLLTLYWLTMMLLSGTKAAVEQFQALWYLMVPLVMGFGIQVGLYTKLREAVRQKSQTALAASGTSAGVGMLACCAHHTVDILPVLGLSAAATIIARYQVPLLTVSLFINGIGIVVMWSRVKEVT